MEQASSAAGAGIEASFRKGQGRLLIVAFEGSAPEAWRREGVVLDVRAQSGESAAGVVLPVGSSNRIVLRMERDISSAASAGPVVVGFVSETTPPVPSVVGAQANLRLVTAPLQPEINFSVATLMRDEASYSRMVSSFEAFGFTPANTEFLAIDNRVENTADGYQGARLAAEQARGRFLIFCHDDVELMQDSHDDLLSRLAELEASDPNWMMAGVAGGLYRGFRNDGKRRIASRISDRWGPGRSVKGPFPRRVESLDECFLISPRSRFPGTSLDLSGFHFFGTDMCLRAELSGGSAYVLDFHLFHYGKARKGDEYWAQKEAFEKKYRSYFPGRIVQTCTKPLNFGPLAQKDRSGPGGGEE